MTDKELAQYLLQALNMGLGNIMQGETSYTNSFDIKILQDGFLFIPRLPAGYIIDDNLYQKIFLIANAALFPRYTVLKQNSAYFLALETDDIHVQRGLFFPWKEGISERLVISDLDRFALEREKNIIPIMKNLTLDFNKVTSVAIAGNSGSGKSYALTYFLSLLKNFSDLIIVDPKFDTPSSLDSHFHFVSQIPYRRKSTTSLLHVEFLLLYSVLLPLVLSVLILKIFSTLHNYIIFHLPLSVCSKFHFYVYVYHIKTLCNLAQL